MLFIGRESWLSSLSHLAAEVTALQALHMLSTCIVVVVSDLEKRKNPVCHFVTPLDGSVDVDEHRRPEVCETLGTAQ